MEMENYFTQLWQRLTAHEVKTKAEVDRIDVLQLAAAARRAEYAQEKEQSKLAGDAAIPGALASSRKRMEEAQAVHMAALHKWENKQSGQKSR